MATNGSFTHLALQFEPRSRALLSTVGILVAALVAGLVVLLAVRPTDRAFGCSMALGILAVPFGIALLPIHGSGAALVVLGPVLALASWFGGINSPRP